jgi:hypothetical protein
MSTLFAMGSFVVSVVARGVASTSGGGGGGEINLPLWATIIIVIVCLIALGFVARVIWRMTSNEKRFHYARRIKEKAQKKDEAERAAKQKRWQELKLKAADSHAPKEKAVPVATLEVQLEKRIESEDA